MSKNYFFAGQWVVSRPPRPIARMAPVDLPCQPVSYLCPMRGSPGILASLPRFAWPCEGVAGLQVSQTWGGKSLSKSLEFKTAVMKSGYEDDHTFLNTKLFEPSLTLHSFFYYFIVINIILPRESPVYPVSIILRIIAFILQKDSEINKEDKTIALFT